MKKEYGIKYKYLIQSVKRIQIFLKGKGTCLFFKVMSSFAISQLKKINHYTWNLNHTINRNTEKKLIRNASFAEKSYVDYLTIHNERRSLNELTTSKYSSNYRTCIVELSTT